MIKENVDIANPWLLVPVYAILFFQGTALVARSFLDVQLRDNGMNPGLATDLSYLVVPPLLLALMFPILKKHGRLLGSLFSLRVLSVRMSIVGIALGVLTFLAAVSTNIALSSWEILNPGGPMLAAGLASSWTCERSWPLFLGIGISVFLIPVIEESINRGFLLRYFLPKGKLIAILVSSILFAVFHEPHAMLPAFVIGIYLANLTLNTNSLLPATIAHCTHNLLVQIDVHCIALDWTESSTVFEIVESGAMAIGATAFLLILAAILVTPKITGARTVPL